MYGVTNRSRTGFTRVREKPGSPMPLQVTPLPSDPSLTRALALHLLGAPAAGPWVDLTDTVVIVPAARASASLARHLQDLAGRPVLLPTILTPGRSLAHFVIPARTAASDEALTLACLGALQHRALHAPDSIAPLLPATPDGAAVQPPKLPLATQLAALASELSRAGVSSRDVLERGATASLGEFFPEPTWESIADVLDDAMAHLHQLGFDLPHRLAAEAIERRQLVTAGIRRVVVLLADPSALERRLLSNLADLGVIIDVVVHAEALADLVDGFPDHAAWSRVRPLVPIRRIIRVASVEEQPAVVLTALAEMPQPVQAESVAIAALGASDAALLSRALSPRGIPITLPPSRTADQGSAALLLRSVAHWHTEPTLHALGTLLRHPWVEAHFVSSGLPNAIRLTTEFAVGTGADRLEGPQPDGPDRYAAMAVVRKAVSALLADLAEALCPRTQAAVRNPAAPLHALHRLIQLLHPVASPPADAAASQAVVRALLDLSALPSSLLSFGTLEQLVELTCSVARTTDLPSEQGPGIPCMGWLEAGVCDEPAVVVLSANDGLMPESTPVDPWLPDALRQTLGLPCARARRARDAWLLDGLLRRKSAIWFGIPSTNADGEPMQPSRLLLGSTDGDQASRVCELRSEAGLRSVAEWPHGARVGDGLTTHPPPVPMPTIRHIAVTRFSTYLTCPYQFLLEQAGVLRKDDQGLELDPMAFGTLLHTVLQEWGLVESDRPTPTTDAKRLERDLMSALDRVLDRLPVAVHGAVTLQRTMLRERLRAFAPVQAEWAEAGWRIRMVEVSFIVPPSESQAAGPPVNADSATHDIAGTTAPARTQYPAPKFPDASGLWLTGRIDRVDVNERTGEWIALDYKSSQEPFQAKDHLPASGKSKGQWKNLQLPLYRVLLRAVEPQARDLRVGIISLPAHSDATQFVAPSHWTADDFSNAEQTAAEIVARVQAGEFTPSGRAPSDKDPLVQALFGKGIRGLSDGDDEDEEGEG